MKKSLSSIHALVLNQALANYSQEQASPLTDAVISEIKDILNLKPVKEKPVKEKLVKEKLVKETEAPIKAPKAAPKQAAKQANLFG